MTDRPPRHRFLPAPAHPRSAAVIVVALTIVGILALTMWYLVRPQPLLIQGEADASRTDIAAASVKLAEQTYDRTRQLSTAVSAWFAEEKANQANTASIGTSETLPQSVVSRWAACFSSLYADRTSSVHPR